MQNIYIFSDEEKEKITFIRNLFDSIKQWNKKQFKISRWCKRLYLYTPKAYSDNTVNKYLLNNEKEIYKKSYRTYIPNSQEIKVKKNQILFLGKLYTFEYNKKLQETYKIDDDNLIISSNNNLNIKKNLLEFYNTQAKIIFKERVQYYSEKLNITINKLSIGAYKSILGSFGYNGNISLNEKLILTPIPTIDCIINHEFAHAYHANHSQDYYNKLEEIYPAYYKDYIWLRLYMPDMYPPKKEE